MSFMLDAASYELLRAQVRDALPGPFYIPDWLVRDTGVTAGQSVFDTAMLGHYEDGGYLIAFDDTGQELLTIDSIGSVVETTTGATKSYKFFSPALKCFAPEGLSASIIGGPNFSVSMDFQCYDAIAPDDADLVFYNGDPLLLDCPKLKSLSERLERQVILVDNDVSIPFIEDAYNNPRQHLSAAWMPAFGQEIYDLRAFFQSLYGRQKRFWMPAWNRGINLVSDISGTSMTIDNINYTDTYGSGHIYIQMDDGTYHAVAVTGSVDNGATETLTLSESLTVSKSNVDLIALLMQVRLNADRVEFSAIPGFGANVAVPVVEITDEGDTGV